MDLLFFHVPGHSLRSQMSNSLSSLNVIWSHVIILPLVSLFTLWLWNLLPNEVKKALTVGISKSKVKSYLFYLAFLKRFF